jgi:hypothetical protein
LKPLPSKSEWANGEQALMEFEEVFLEINGRRPTVRETQRHLAFDRLAKTTDLDPATLLLIVDPPQQTPQYRVSLVELRGAILGAVIVAVLFCVATNIDTHPSVLLFVASNIAVACAIFLLLWWRQRSARPG